MKNILLAVVGLSPQVVTETLFALHQQRRTVDAIHLITTRRGKEIINAHLLSPTDGQYYQYLQEYSLDRAAIDFGFHTIHTIKTKRGSEIDDIEGAEENELLLKACLDLTFQFTRDPDTAVFFSIAGGRKTMSACLMVAAQFYARPQDRIYHVLVTPEFENNPDFYYPPRKSITIELKDAKGEPVYKETKYAAVTLVPIPFVSIRDRIADELLQAPHEPATLMQSLIKDEPAQLTIDLTGGKLMYKKVELDLMPAHLALYAFFALQKKSCRREVSVCGECTECFVDIQDVLSRSTEIADLYRQVAGTRPLEEMSDSGIVSLNKQNFQSVKSKIRHALQKAYGLYALLELAIDSVGKKPDTRYGIPISKERIRVVL